MAAVTVLSAMSAEGEKTVHPFFTRQHVHSQTTDNDTNADETKSEDATVVEQDTTGHKHKSNTSKRKKKDGQPQGLQQPQKTQKTLGEIVTSQGAPVVQQSVTLESNTESESNTIRRKRRRTNEQEAIEVGSEQAEDPDESNDAPRTPADTGSCSPQVLISASSPLPATSLPVLDDPSVPETPPKKLLKLNANGKFSSPPSKKAKDTEGTEAGATRRSSRQRKLQDAAPEKRLIVKLSYRQSDGENSIGHRISRMLEGKERVDAETPKSTPKKRKKRTPQKTKPAKSTHPFFNRRGPKEEAPIPERRSPRKTSAVNPGKLRVKSHAERIQESKDVVPAFTSALLRDRLMIKHPGAKESPFPAKGQGHVRSIDSDEFLQLLRESGDGDHLGQRKRKRARQSLSERDSILRKYASELTADQDRHLRPDGFYEPDKSLRLPDRLLIVGQDIAERVSREVSVSLVSENQDELALSSQKRTHPALNRLFARIPTTMTAFDESRGEWMAWTQKYAPDTSADVLQPGNEMAVLVDWLKSHAVQSVGGAVAQPIKSEKPLKTAEKPKKKRKKKAADLDDFLVDSEDDEPPEMKEIADQDGKLTASSRKIRSSEVQAVQDGTKLSNAVLLSGPHGCGKTAAAYAVAKELGYKVFEISSSERRSGRDVLDKVGDMTENHLVKHHGTEDPGELSASEEPGRNEEAFQKDLESGRQGKMSAFFQPQTKIKPAVEPKKIIKEKKLKAVQEALKRPPKDQQQSLILLEEVDVLFKDDKEFWSTVLKLISTSKRPFIMTCNDEDLVPRQAMSLHAILRFVQPGAELATNYILLLAAAEGHLLKHEAVASLYRHHNCDLRASITELDYWCQVGVGDPREGLSWIYQRYPPGSDQDEQGRRYRTVSQGTYQKGMDIPSDIPDPEEALRWLWNEHEIEPSAAMAWPQQRVEDQNAHPLDEEKQRIQGLKDLARLADDLSAADVVCANGLAGTAPLDPTQPEMPNKHRSHYIEGMALLQSDERIDWTGMSKDLLMAITLSAFRKHNVYDIDVPAKLEHALQQKGKRQDDEPLSRHAFACFDAISTPAEVSLTNPGLQQSAFDGTLRTITTDLAPYVRTIVQHDQALEEQRDRLNLLTSDGRSAKRARTTRAARSALEGGLRATTRRERWFSQELDIDAVLSTGGRNWPRFWSAPDTASVGETSRDDAGSVGETSIDAMDVDTAPASTAESEEIRYEG